MKRHLTQKCTPLLALFLSLVLLLSGMVPLSYFSFAAAEFSAEASAPEAAEEPTALYELTELRQADTKYIQMSDGTVRALVYDTAVHRPDGQEGYTEIDNRLSEKGDGVENADARIKFSKKITGNGTLFTLHEGNRKITLSLPGAVKKTPVTVVRDGTDNTKAATKLEELSTLSKAVSSVGYRNILPQTDIEYILQGDNLKENIVVNAPRESYEYIFELELCNLTASLTDTGDIALNDGEERIYILPAPFMYDADGRYSEAVEYTLTPSNGNGKYTLTVTADESWLNAEKRTFPVTIDPTITAACTPQTASTVISSSGGTVRHCFTLGQNTPAYILLSNLPNALELPVLAAELRLNAYQCSSGLAGARLSLYSMEYTGTFEDLISGNAEVPDSALHPIDTQYVNGWMQFTYDLLDTGFFLGALNGENLYYKLTMTENEYDENLLFYSCEATGDGQKPVLTITYGYLQSRVLDYAESDKGFFITDTYQPQFAGDYQSIRILVTQNNSSIPALHEYGTQPDARGFFHLISGETGFKIFGTYDLNYLYIAENEGTKTPRFGATQDEWVIVGMRNYDYLILSAEDPTLSLTRTDTGVALQSLEKDNEDQVWRFYENIMTQSADVRYIQSGIYYINNNQTKTFLTQKQDYLLGIQLEAGTEAALGNRMAWYIGYAGDGQYMIQSLENPDYILTAGASSPMLVPQEVFDDTETFQITPSPNGGYSIKCTYTMYEDSDETETVYMGVSSSGSLVHCTATDDSTSWRLCKQEDYKELVEFGLYGEEQYRTSPDVLDFYTLNIGDTMAFTTYNHSPSNPTWASFSDYDFLVSSNNVTINRTAMTLTAVNAGNLTFTARHIPTGKTHAFEINTSGLMIYRTRNREREGFANTSDINDITPIIAEDLEYGQKSTGALLQSDTKISLTDLYKNNYTQEQMSVADRIDIINTFFKSQLSKDSPFNDILAEMIDHLVDGTGTDYSNDDLTSAVVNHPKTIAYVDAVVGLLNNYLSQNSGNISGLYYDENLWTNPILRRQHPMVNAMAQGIANGRTELQEPYYGHDNGVPGLTLAIDSWYGNKFEIVSFNKSGNSYSGTLRFSFYDHFGLDTSDLEDKKYGNMQAGFVPGFRQWYILQHWSGLAASVQPKPFVTKVSFTIPFQGTYN